MIIVFFIGYVISYFTGFTKPETIDQNLTINFIDIFKKNDLKVIIFFVKIKYYPKYIDSNLEIYCQR
jgi:hypothetical protein